MENQPNEIAAMPGEIPELPQLGPSRFLGLLKVLHIVGLSLAMAIVFLVTWVTGEFVALPGLFAGVFLLGLLAVRVASKADEIRWEDSENNPANPESGARVTGTVATGAAAVLLLAGFIGGVLLVYESIVALDEIFRTVAETY